MSSFIGAVYNYTKISCSQDIASFTIVGNDSGFNGAKPGEIIKLLMGNSDSGPVFNPIIILDEIDKINKNSNFNIESTLLSILDKRSSEKFKDNFFNVPVNASTINYIATANDECKIPDNIKSRFKIYYISKYEDDELLKVVIPNVYNELLEEYNAGVIPSKLPEPVKEYILYMIESNPRLIKSEIEKLISYNYIDNYFIVPVEIKIPG